MAHGIATTFAVSNVALLLTLWFSRWSEIPVTLGILTLTASLLALLPMWIWFRRGMPTPPLLELIGLYFFFAYCPSVLLGKITFTGVYNSYTFTDEQVVRVFIVLLLGFAALNLGYYLTSQKAALAGLPRMDLDPVRLTDYTLKLFWLSSVLPFVIAHVAIPPGLRKVFSLLTTAIPCVTIYILTFYAAQRRLTRLQSTSFICATLLYFLSCVSGGWLNQLAFPVLFMGIAYVRSAHRIPWIGLTVTIAGLILLNGTKSSFREQYWGEQMGERGLTPLQAIERSVSWVASTKDAIGDIESVTKQTLGERVSSLGFLCHVVTTTPSEHEFTGWWSYMQIPYLLVPRAIWPSKPSVMDAANTVAMRYGYLTPGMVGRVALDTGLIPEAYMSFGTIGVVVFMLLFGAFLRFMVNSFSAQHLGLGWELALLAMIRNGGVMITWSAASYFAGIWQSMLLTAVVFLPIRVRTAPPMHTPPTASVAAPTREPRPDKT